MSSQRIVDFVRQLIRKGARLLDESLFLIPARVAIDPKSVNDILVLSFDAQTIRSVHSLCAIAHIEEPIGTEVLAVGSIRLADKKRFSRYASIERQGELLRWLN